MDMNRQMKADWLPLLVGREVNRIPGEESSSLLMTTVLHYSRSSSTSWVVNSLKGKASHEGNQDGLAAITWSEHDVAYCGNTYVAPCVLSHFSPVCLFVTPGDCSLPDSSVHGILQARIPEWVAISSSRASSRPRDRTHISYVSASLHWQGGSLPLVPPGKHWVAPNILWFTDCSAWTPLSIILLFYWQSYVSLQFEGRCYWWAWFTKCQPSVI